MNDYEIYRQAVEHFGKLNQLIKTMEECGELIRALARWINGQPVIGNIAEEIADVEIMLEQVKVVLGEQYEEYLELKKTEKLGRLAKLIAGEKYSEEENA